MSIKQDASARQRVVVTVFFTLFHLIPLAFSEQAVTRIAFYAMPLEDGRNLARNENLTIIRAARWVASHSARREKNIADYWQTHLVESLVKAECFFRSSTRCTNFSNSFYCCSIGLNNDCYH